MDAKLVVVDNCWFENGHHLSLLKDDLIEFDGDHAIQNYSSDTDELTLCMWKASALRSTPMEGGRLVAANILQNSPAPISSETSHPAVTCTLNSCLGAKFITVFCSARFCSVFGLFNQEHVVFRLCTNVPDIERVVLGVGRDDAFRWASGESFRTELRAVVTKQILLCVEGCNFDIHLGSFSLDCPTGFWDQLRVVNCIPVRQGRLTEASEVVVKYCSEQDDTSHRYKHSCRNCYSSHCDDAKAVMVSDFAADVSNNYYFLPSPKMDIYLKNLHPSAPTHELNFTVLKDINRMKYFVTFQQSQNISDELSVAVLSRQCASRLGIMNGSMLELLCKSHEQQQCKLRSLAAGFSETQQHSCGQKVVIACVNTTYNSDDEMACLSSCAWFNLCSMSCVSLSGNCDIKPCYMKVCLCVLLFSYIMFSSGHIQQCCAVTKLNEEPVCFSKYVVSKKSFLSDFKFKCKCKCLSVIVNKMSWMRRCRYGSK